MSNTATLNEGQVLIPTSRVGYLKVWKAEGIKGDPSSKPRFGCQIYLPKSDTATKAKIDKELARLSKLHFKGIIPKQKDICVKDGDGDDGDENTEGCWIISANRAESQGRPQVVDRARRPLNQDDNKVYSGCYCNVLVAFFVPKNWGKICASLEVVQFVKDGEPFGGGRVDAETVMPDLGDDEDDI